MFMKLVIETTFVELNACSTVFLSPQTQLEWRWGGKVIPQSYTILEYLLTQDEVTFLVGEGSQPEACSSVVMMRDKITQVLMSILHHFLNLYLIGFLRGELGPEVIRCGTSGRTIPPALLEGLSCPRVPL